MPFSAASFAPFERACVISTIICSESTSRTTPPIFPSSNQIAFARLDVPEHLRECDAYARRLCTRLIIADGQPPRQRFGREQQRVPLLEEQALLIGGISTMRLSHRDRVRRTAGPFRTPCRPSGRARRRAQRRRARARSCGATARARRRTQSRLRWPARREIAINGQDRVNRRSGPQLRHRDERHDRRLRHPAVSVTRGLTLRTVGPARSARFEFRAREVHGDATSRFSSRFALLEMMDDALPGRGASCAQLIRMQSMPAARRSRTSG